MTSRSSRWFVAGCIACALSVTMEPTARAQERFALLGRDIVPSIAGLSIYTVRDEQRSACYALFILEQAAPTLKAPVAAQPATAPAASRPEVPMTPEREPRGDRPEPAPELWAVRPSTTPTPGPLTGGWEYLAESIRLALVHPATANALAEPVNSSLNDVADRLARIETLLKEAAAQQRFAVVPVSCAPAERK